MVTTPTVISPVTTVSGSDELTDDINLEEIAAPDENAPVYTVIETEDEAALRNMIFQAKDLQQEMVYVPDWKTNILVRALTGNQRATLLQSTAQTRGQVDMKKMYPDLVILSARHPRTERPVFKPADRDELLKKSGGALEKIALTAARLSGIMDKTMEQATKN